MKTFQNVKFNGTFRDYQKRVIDNAPIYLANKKIHIVAAPGSGKTILGLELIRMLNSPTLVLSPTITIKNQWQDRFSMFLPKGEIVEDYVSTSLKHMKLITSSTYQALHSAMNRIKETKTKQEEDDVFEEEKEDYTNFDLIKAVKKIGIKTICLDEAHHLRTEWYKSLTKFLLELGLDITIIALTATPPYDSNQIEWDNYISLCGEIDEEVLVPELVKKNNLCPHQDFVYYNLPTASEQNSIDDYTRRSWKAVEEIASSKTLVALNDKISLWFKRKANVFYDNLPIIIGVYALFEYYKFPVDKKILKYLKKNTNYQRLTLETANKWLNSWQENQTMYGLEGFKEIEKILRENGQIFNKKIMLGVNQNIIKDMMSSQSKLNSIVEIVKVETNNLKKDLRMLILTDYIKKDGLKLVGTNEEYNEISVISIYETLRRCNLNINYAVLTGTVVILNKNVLPLLYDLAKKENCTFTTKELKCTEYVICTFKGASNKKKVNIITNLFQMGKIEVVIGTKSLLGEGWDSPNINSLILASFVGSFMLSNQMRGRAIRIDSKVKDKVSNIWHLVTIIPSKDSNMNAIVDSDFETLTRRFKSFLAPNYKTNVIEDGYERTIPLQSFDSESVMEHNKTTVAYASNRENTRNSWQKAVDHYEYQPFKRTLKVARVVNAKPKLNIYDIFKSINWALYLSVLIFMLGGLIFANRLKILFCLPFMIYSIYLAIRFIVYYLNMTSFKSFIKTVARAVVKTLKEMDIIESGVKIYFKKSKKNKYVIYNILVGNCDNKQQENLIISTIQEMLKPIDNPRYLIIRKNGKTKFDYRLSFAVPKIIGSNKNFATLLSKNINKTLCQCGVVYTKSENGNKQLQRARKMSVLNSMFALEKRQTQ